MTQQEINIIYNNSQYFNGKNQLICVCVIYNAIDVLDDFMRTHYDLFDGFIIIDASNTPEKKDQRYYNIDYKLLAYCASKNNKLTSHSILSFISNFNLGTICLMYGNERLVKGYDNIREYSQNLCNTGLVGIILSNKNDDKYFLNNMDINRVSYEKRLFKHYQHCISSKKVQNFPILIKKYIDTTDWQFYNIDSFSMKRDISELIYKNNRFINYSLISNQELRIWLRKEVKEINDYFINGVVSCDKIGVLGGESGTCLLFAQMYLLTKDSLYLTKLKQTLDIVVDSLNNASQDRPITPYFSNGIAGVGWLFCYIKENGITSIPGDYLFQIDSILCNVFDNLQNIPIDPLHGSLGIARYFLKRKNKIYIQKMLDHLNILAHQYKKNAVYWLAQSPGSTNFVDNIDLGLAHGIAGILYFIIKAYELGVNSSLCLKMGEGIINFYIDNEQDHKISKCFYPNKVLANKLIKHPEFSRLAWCYGDLSILYMFFLFYYKTGNQNGKDEVIKKLKQTTIRKSCTLNGIKDAMLCHGSSGIAHIYHRLYLMTGISEFYTATIYWLKISIYISRDETTYPPFKFVTSLITEHGVKKDNWSESYGLLEGVIGMNLVFISALSGSHMNWDEIIMLS